MTYVPGEGEANPSEAWVRLGGGREGQVDWSWGGIWGRGRELAGEVGPVLFEASLTR